MARILALVLGRGNKRGDVSSDVEGEIPVLVLRVTDKLSDGQIKAQAEGKRKGGINTLSSKER